MMRVAVILGLSISSLLMAGQQFTPTPRPPTGCPALPVSVPAQAIGADDFVELQRTECYGTCPTYTVRIRGNGQIAWNGGTFVKTAGISTSSVEVGQAQALIEKTKANGFWGLCADYGANITDFPTSYTTVRVANQEKKIRNYANAAPQALRDLESEIDAVANTYRWIHGEPQSNVFAFVVRNDPAATPLPTQPIPYRSGPGVVLYPITRLGDILNRPKPGMTDLMRASGRTDLAEVQRLIAANADPDAQDSSGWTALMYATNARTNSSSTDVIRALLTAGADPNKESAMGQTAIMAASNALWSRSAMLRLLVNAGGDIQVQDKNGHTSLMFAATGIYGMHTLSETDNRSADYADALSFLMQGELVRILPMGTALRSWIN